MDGPRFDIATRALTGDTPRRGVLGLLLGSALGLAGLTGTAGGKGKKKGKKKKKKSDRCATFARECKGGCGNGAECCSTSDCEKCRNLRCSEEGSPGTCGCAPGEEMFNGVCGARPVCVPTGTIRQMFEVRCCSGNEVTDITDPENGKCLPGATGCLSNADCTSGKCHGFECASPTLECDFVG